MPNMTGAFFDQNPEFEVTENSDADAQDEIDSVQYADLRLATARATAEVEFMTVIIPGLSGFRLLSYDASRVRVILASDTGSAWVASHNILAIASNALQAGAIGPTGVNAPLPAFNIPTVYNNGISGFPLELRTQSELWVYNNSAGATRVWYMVEKYASN